MVAVFVLGWFGVRLSTAAGTILGLFEILVFAALAVTLIFQAGDATLEVFGTSGSPTSRASPACRG